MEMLEMKITLIRQISGHFSAAGSIFACVLLSCIVPCKTMNKFMNIFILIAFISVYIFTWELLYQEWLWLIETGSEKWLRGCLYSVSSLYCINVHYFIIALPRVMMYHFIVWLFLIYICLISEMIFSSRLFFEQVFI